MVLCSCTSISQSANMAKTQIKKKISQKIKDLNFINEMKISKKKLKKSYLDAQKQKECFKQKYE